jgi:Flp pilus assembly protein TadG
LEFSLVAGPLIVVLFGFLAVNMVFHTWSSMQHAAQFAARMISTGQVTNFANGPISGANPTSTITCGGNLTVAQAEYHACANLPAWTSFTVTASRDCATPAVTVSISTNAQTAAIADLAGLFGGKTIVARAVVMAEGQCV